jgi:hypothetical protein
MEKQSIGGHPEASSFFGSFDEILRRKLESI